METRPNRIYNEYLSQNDRLYYINGTCAHKCIMSFMQTTLPLMDQLHILWNAVTSPENFLNGYSVKTMLYKPPPTYFSVLDC